MDSLTEWYRYIDQVSRPARKSSEEDEEPELWRPWKPIEDAPAVEAAIPADAIPDLSAALGLSVPSEALHPASVEYVDPTVHDQLAPIPTFSAPALSAPAFEITIPRLAERRLPTSPESPSPSPSPRPELHSTELERDLEESSSVPTDFEFAAEESQAFREEQVARPAAERDTDILEMVEAEAESPSGKGQGFRHWDLLSQIRSHDVAQNSYKSAFRETREELVQRLLDPPLTLEEAARLLGVCPTTVRRYTNKGQLRHFRTSGNQRRFRLSDVLEFLESRATEIEADARADRAAGLEN